MKNEFEKEELNLIAELVEIQSKKCGWIIGRKYGRILDKIYGVKNE